MDHDPFSRRIPQLFWKCIVLSLSVHFLIISVLYWHPLWVAKWFSLFPHPFTQKTVAYHIENELFEGIFDDLVVISHPKNIAYDAPQPREENSLPFLENSSVTLEKPNALLTPFSPYITEQTEGFLLREPKVDFPLLASSLELPHPVSSLENSDLATIELPPLEPMTIASEKTEVKTCTPQTQPVDPLPFVSSQESTPCSLNPVEELYSAIILTPDLQKQQISGLSNAPSTPQFSREKATMLGMQAYGFPKFDPGQEWRHLFHVDVQIMPRKEQEGLFFAVTLVPKPEAALKTLKQHFHFIVDCSKKTEMHRISVYKRALARSLGYLQDGHTFNIYFIDKTIQVLSHTPVTVSRKTIQQAKEFLEKQTPKGLGVKESLLPLLQEIAKTAKEHAASAEIDSVILLTDGNILEEPNRKKQPLKEWLKEGPPPFTLYAATIGSDAHPPILDAVTIATGGKVLHSSTHAAFPRKFAKLLIDLKAPIATHVTSNLFIENSSSAISLMGTCCRMSPLFASQPTTFFGVATGPDDFTLHLQGMGKDCPMEISLNIDLKTCRQGALTFRQIALQDKAEHELSLYLQNGQENHFDQALEWLEGASELRKYK